MSNKKLTVLGVVAAAMVVLTFVQSYVSNRPVLTGKTDIPLIQGLNTIDIASIRLGPPDKTLSLEKEGKRFLVADRDNYPASIKQINHLITSCLDIRIAELVTDNPANHKDLELTEETAKSIVKFLNSKGKLITGVLVGKRDEVGGGDYVRLISNDQNLSRKAYLSLNVPWLAMTAMSYVDKQLFKVAKSEIAEVTVIGAEGSYTIVAGDDDKITLENIPEGKKAKDTVFQKVFTAVTDLEFSDVQKESDSTAKLDFNTTYVCRLKDSSIYTFQLAEKEDKTYVKSFSEFTDKTPVVKKRGVVESEEKLKEKEAKLLARDASIKFNNRHRGWVYEIASWKAVNMTREFEGLVEDKEENGA